MYPINVSCRTEITRKQKKTLKHYGLIWDGSEFNGLIKSERRIEKIKTYCKKEEGYRVPKRVLVHGTFLAKGARYHRSGIFMDQTL